jgi:hypothetical protein
MSWRSSHFAQLCAESTGTSEKQTKKVEKRKEGAVRVTSAGSSSIQTTSRTHTMLPSAPHYNSSPILYASVLFTKKRRKPFLGGCSIPEKERGKNTHCKSVLFCIATERGSPLAAVFLLPLFPPALLLDRL